jgi:hypothetical protein
VVGREIPYRQSASGDVGKGEGRQLSTVRSFKQENKEGSTGRNANPGKDESQKIYNDCLYTRLTRPRVVASNATCSCLEV